MFPRRRMYVAYPHVMEKPIIIHRLKWYGSECYSKELRRFLNKYNRSLDEADETVCTSFRRTY